jgi:hypothetical protein
LPLFTKEGYSQENLKNQYYKRIVLHYYLSSIKEAKGVTILKGIIKQLYEKGYDKSYILPVFCICFFNT